ncbi:MAG: phosphoribosylformylglycinamidine synthase [Oscillospiraceae bacterium]|jgi:phosphoribosylformylglycinamidine synthase|nr:phosphoribosylformylglycinamidine synthase [Oscillospiraceae bacterium]
MVYRLFVEKKEGLDNEARALLSDINTLLGISSVHSLRLFNRYDVEHIEKELYESCKTTIFSEPQLDNIFDALPEMQGACVFAVEYLPGQYDQRADSAAQCVQLVSQKERPAVRTARVFALFGSPSQEELAVIKKYVINPVESREASLAKYDTLAMQYDIPQFVAVLEGFLFLDAAGLAGFIEEYALAMDADDIQFCQDYFKEEGRDPTLTEVRMIDTYWSDHCRHTTFLTTIDSAEIEDSDVKEAYDRYLKIRGGLGRTKPINLMDIATIGARYLKAKGKLPRLDESEEINACTVKIDVEVGGGTEEWLLLFKNETHNHPTEIEPFGGAATCIGGAIRDPLSGRAYVYQAMRVTGAANPLADVNDTIEGKLPQRKIVTTAAAGYSSYGNQIGLATGLVDEIYHEGYMAKRMEIGAVVGAAPAKNVRREVPSPGDKVVLLGGRTGRDGCGGATGSSKSHTLESLESCGAEVQKGNAPEERKLQRLFRNPEATRLIKRCNDFGAGGVSVAIGELADGLCIDLNAVPKKYDGLDGTELAISESQERMAVVLSPEDVDAFIAFAGTENLEATVVAEVCAEPRLTMVWNGQKIVDIKREFLNSNGAEKHTAVSVNASRESSKALHGSLFEKFISLSNDLNVCSKRGLSERFDSTIGAGSVMMPFGGRYQRTPAQVMAAKIPVLEGDTATSSVMAWGYNPFITSENVYIGAYLAVIESISKLVASGAPLNDCYLTFQEYFEKPKKDPNRWGKPFAALLGALAAQLDLGFAAIGGKDSMSGSFEDIDVPPTLVSFAVTVANAGKLLTPEFKLPSSKVALLQPVYLNNGLPEVKSYQENIALLQSLAADGKILAAYTPTYGGVAEALMKMAFGNGVGIELADDVSDELLFSAQYGSFILELAEDVDVGQTLGLTTSAFVIRRKCEVVDLDTVQNAYERRLEDVFACNLKSGSKEPLKAVAYKTEKYPNVSFKVEKPRVLIPVFPGTNCEYDTAKAIEKAGGTPEIIVICNLTPGDVAQSVSRFAELVDQSQIILIPGGFSGGDEPDGSGKFITAFFRNPLISDKVNTLLRNRDGLMAGICNGFQALIKLGLVPYGEIVETARNSPTLTYNTIARHQSKIVRTKIASNKSIWLSKTELGEVYSVPISHGEGRFYCPVELLELLAQNGQIATQYVDLKGDPTMDIQFNPNGSAWAVEGITSPDGRIFGKMGHAERVGLHLYQNVPGNYDLRMFEAAIGYFNI